MQAQRLRIERAGQSPAHGLSTVRQRLLLSLQPPLDFPPLALEVGDSALLALLRQASNIEQAIKSEDQLNYIEPADWYLPARESLGALYLRIGDAADAEKTFRADLGRNRRNPRSLFGLIESLKAQGKTYAARLVQQEFDAVWRQAEVRELRLEDL